MTIQFEQLLNSCGTAEIIPVAETDLDNIYLITISERSVFGNPNYIHDLQMLTRKQSKLLTQRTRIKGKADHAKITGFGTTILLLKTMDGQAKVVSLMVWYSPDFKCNIIGHQIGHNGVLLDTYKNQHVLRWGVQWISEHTPLVKLLDQKGVPFISGSNVIQSSSITSDIEESSDLEEEEEEEEGFQLLDVYANGIIRAEETQKSESESEMEEEEQEEDSDNQRKTVAGVGIFFDDGNDRSRSIRITNCDNPTLQIAELVALRETLQIILLTDLGKSDSKYRINTNSLYGIKCLNSWYKLWEENGWKKSNRRSVKNQKLIKKCLEYIDIINRCYNSKNWGDLEFVQTKQTSETSCSGMSLELAKDACDEIVDGGDTITVAL